MIPFRKFIHLLAALALFWGGAAHADPTDVPPMPLHPDAKRIIGSNQTKQPGDEKAFRDRVKVKSALAEKLLRCAARGELTDPTKLKPLKTCAAWVTATAYRVGDVRTNAGKYYLAVSNATSGATAPTHTEGDAISDGGVQWTFLGGVGSLSDDPDVPTVTSSNATPSAPLTCWWNPTVFPNKYRVLGGYPTYSASTWIRPYAFQYLADGTRGSYGTAVTFKTDAPKFAIFLNSNGTVRFNIDGRPYSQDNYNPYTQLNNDQGWVTFDFGSVRKERLVEVLSNIPSGPYFGGVRTDDLSSVWADTRECVKVAWIGDSLSAGSSYGPFLSGGTITSFVGSALGWEDIRNCSRGGTGWLNRGTGGADYTYRERLTEILAWQPDVIVFFDAVNDVGNSTTSQVAAEVTASLQQIRASSDALVIIFGILPVNDARIASYETAMSGAVTSFNDSLDRTRFISMTSPGDGFPLMSGNWNNAALNFSDSQRLIVANDNLHFPDIGTRIMSRRAVALIRPIIMGLN